MTQLAGTRLLIRLSVRRDRLMLPLWIGALVATVAATIGAFDDLYPDQLSRNGFAVSIQTNVVFRAFYGPLFATDSNGALTAWRLGTIGAMVLGLMSIFGITRHTRQEEETGRLELVGSAMVGRLAPLIAAHTVAVVANVIAGLLSIGVLIGAGQDAAGAIAFGSALTVGGLVFAAVAGVAAQLADTARAANTASVGVLGLAFVVRAIGDSNERWQWLSWLSPLGWTEQVRAYGANRFWVLGLSLLAAAGLAGAALVLNGRRDLGGSLLRSRPGPAAATRSLTGPWGLGWRLQRSALVGWLVAFAVFGAVFGSLAGSISDLVNSSPQIGEILRQVGGPGALVDGYVNAVLGIAAVAATAFGISAMLRLRSAETSVLVEPVLATAVSRQRLIGSTAVFVFLAPAALILVAGLAAGLGANAVLGDGVNHLPALLAGGAVQIPAIWVIGAVAVLLFGLLPRWSVAAWGGLALCAVLALIGPVLNLPQAVLDLSPFTAVPRIVGDEAVSPLPILVLVAISVVLTGVGVAGFGRRDIG